MLSEPVSCHNLQELTVDLNKSRITTTC